MGEDTVSPRTGSQQAPPSATSSFYCAFANKTPQDRKLSEEGRSSEGTGEQLVIEKASDRELVGTPLILDLRWRCMRWRSPRRPRTTVLLQAGRGHLNYMYTCELGAGLPWFASFSRPQPQSRKAESLAKCLAILSLRLMTCRLRWRLIVQTLDV